MGRIFGGFLIGLLATFAFLQWNQTHRNERETIDRNPITGTVTKTVEVGEMVTGLNALNRLVVFQAYLTAVTEAEECRFWGCPIKSSQALLTPGYVNYYIDMGRVGSNSISVNDDQTAMTVTLPPLMIERPNIDTLHQRFFNEGAFSDLTGADRRLEERTRPAALRQLQGIANQRFLVTQARRQALSSVYINTRRVLNRMGHEDVSLTVKF